MHVSALQITLTQFYERLAAGVPEGGNSIHIGGKPGAPLKVIADPAADASNLVGPRTRVIEAPVRIEHVQFDDFVDLSEHVFGQSLRIERCRFNQGLRLADTRVKGLFSLRRTRLAAPGRGWIDARRLRVDGWFDLSLVRSKVGIDLSNLHSGDDVRLDGLIAQSALRKKADVEAASACDTEERRHLQNDMLGKALNFEGARIGRHLYVYPVNKLRCVVRGGIDLRTKVAGNIEFKAATIEAAASGVAVDFEAAEVGQSVFFDEGTRVTGRVDLRARIAGNVEFVAATVEAAAGEVAIDLEAANVSGSAFFHKGTKVTGRVDLRAKVAGNIEFNAATVDAGTSRVAVTMNGAEVGGAVFFHSNAVVTGQVSLRTKVAGNIEFNAATVDAGTGGLAVDMIRAVVGGSAFFHKGTKVTGRVDLRAKVAGNIELVAATVDAGTGRLAVNVNGAEVGRSVFFNDGTKVTGRVDLRAKVAGSIEFKAATVDAGTDRLAVNVNRAEVGRSVFFNNGTKVTGRVDLRAKVAGSVELVAATVDAGTDRLAFNMAGAEVGRSVFFNKGTKVTGRVDLRAKVAGSVEFKAATVDAGTDRLAVNMNGAEVGRSVFFNNGTKVTGRVDLRAKVAGSVEFKAATVDAGTDRLAFNMAGAEVGGTIFFSGGAGVTGPVNAYGLQCGGIQSIGAHFEHCVNLKYAIVHGRIVFIRSELLGGVNLLHGTVEGDLILNDTTLGVGESPGQTGNATLVHVEARHLVVQGDLLGTEMRLSPDVSDVTRDAHWNLEAAEIQGNVTLTGTTVPGDLKLEEAVIHGSVNLSRALVRGNLILRSATVRGRVFAEESEGTGPYPRVMGDVDLRFASLKQVQFHFEQGNPEETPLCVRMEGVRAEDVVFQGSVAAVGVRPNLELDGMEFGSIVSGMTVEPTDRSSPWLALFVGGTGMVATVGVHYWSSRIGAPPSRWWVLVIGFVYWAAIVAAARESVPRFTWRDTARLVVWVAMVCTAAVLLTGMAWRFAIAAYVALVVYAYRDREIRRSRKENGVSRVLDLLGRAEFSRGLYMKVEQWLRSQGDEQLADEVFISRRKRETNDDDQKTEPDNLKERQPIGLFQRWWRGFIDLSTGYGARVGRAVHVFLLLWVINTGVFSNPLSVERPISYMQERIDAIDNKHRANGKLYPAAETLLENPWPADGGVPKAGEWSSHDGFFMAMRTQFPLISLMAENDWEPSSRPIKMLKGITYENYASACMVLNLILLPTIIVGLTGYLKKDR